MLLLHLHCAQLTQFQVHSFLLGRQNIHLYTFHICLPHVPLDSQYNGLVRLGIYIGYRIRMDRACSRLFDHLQHSHSNHACISHSSCRRYCPGICIHQFQGGILWHGCCSCRERICKTKEHQNVNRKIILDTIRIFRIYVSGFIAQFIKLSGEIKSKKERN